MFIHASLTVSSDERLLSLVRAFGREFAGAAGLRYAEQERLVRALEEAVKFVCERAYPGDSTGRIEIALEPAERGIRAAVHDWGRPLISAEGLDELLPRGAPVEDLRLINLGARGKRLSFIWRTPHLIDFAAAVAEAPPPVVAAAEAKEIGIRDARPQDAEPIAQLLYENYALSYVHPDFYRPQWFRDELHAGRVLSTVAEHDGEVIAHHALLPAPDAPTAETGVAVVAPAYRGLGVFGRLSEHTLARARATGLHAVYGRAVTVHPYSQRAELAHGYCETALCLAASPGRMPTRGIRTPTEPGRRTALMISFLPLRRESRQASLPERYRDRLLETYDRLGLDAPAPVERIAGAPGVVAVARDSEASAAVLSIRGRDDELPAEAISKARMLLAEHVDVIYADLDLVATVDAETVVEALCNEGFSYSGLWLHGPGNHDHLRLQRLNSTEIELHDIATASPAGHELVRYVLAELEGVAFNANHMSIPTERP
jgi:anti-sigma regulatory factor (Ser/Thr protein kinase)/N-acetylglutamate synthase-like GNAT family acetyltransferase